MSTSPGLCTNDLNGAQRPTKERNKGTNWHSQERDTEERKQREREREPEQKEKNERKKRTVV